MPPPSAPAPPGPGELRPLEADRDLLDGYRRGDREALAEIFRRYLPVVMRALRGGARVRTADGVTRLPPGVSEAELEGLAQDTFLRAFSPRARESYDGLRPFTSYLVTIAKNLLIDAARKRMRQPGMVSLDEMNAAYLDRVAQTSDVSDEHVEDQELGRVLGEFLAGLSSDDRELWRVRFEEQRSLREAAKVIGGSLFVLRKRDARLRLALLEHLKAEGFLKHARVDVGTSILDRTSRKEDSDE